MFGWTKMSGMCAFEVSLGSRRHDRLSYSPTIRLAIQSSILNCADGQTSSSLPHALPIRFLKLHMASVITLRYDPLLLPHGPQAQADEHLDIALACSCANNANTSIPCDEYVDV